MIGLEDRRKMARHMDKAHENGARLAAACEFAGISVRTLQRWKAGEGLQSGDGRPQAVRPPPAHALKPEERQRLLEVANEPRFADMPPARIVPALADEGVYIASESTLLPDPARAWPKRSPRPCQGAQGIASADDPRGHRTASGLELGCNVPTGHGRWSLVAGRWFLVPGSGFQVCVQVPNLELEP